MDTARSRRVLDALRRAHARGARLVGFCSGAFTIAEAGLLDGRRAACHWMWADSFRARFPSVTLESDVLFVDGGNVWINSWEARLSDLRWAVGPGFRYDTPIGPVRLDVGLQLNPIDGLVINGVPEKRKWRAHFSIGQAF